LDFVLTRVNSDGSQQRYQVSGEPMFNRLCSYIGYRGIGVERLGGRVPGLGTTFIIALQGIFPPRN
jgi:microcystin-dependent protein